LLLFILVGCAAPEATKRRAAAADPTEEGSEERSDVESTASETETDAERHPLGSRWEAERRQAVAGCERTATSLLTGAVRAVLQHDDFGWPVSMRLYSGGSVVSEVQTTYVRQEGRVVSSEVVRALEAPIDTGCEAQTETVSTMYDIAERPVRVLTTTAGCGASVERETLIEYAFEDDELLYSAAYEEGELIRYITYDRCAMVRTDDDDRYRNRYVDGCELDYVEHKRFGWFWYYEDQRPVRYVIENVDDDTLYTYRGCLDG
jgi:hypothetical protein